MGVIEPKRTSALPQPSSSNSLGDNSTSFAHFWSRLNGYQQRWAAHLLFRKPLVINTKRPLVSFTFDDFPRSALFVGGEILNRLGLAGTYYASFGLMGRDAPTGKIFLAGDVKKLLDQNHELGCHTFAHCHSWETGSSEFEASVVENGAALSRLVPGSKFESLSYPISPPKPLTKVKVARHFQCCRGGGQTINAGAADLNHLSAYFLERAPNIETVKELIDRNRRDCGWLIFATHDIADDHTPYGCKPEFFEDVVRYAVQSGARILPVVKALDVLRAPELQL
jgi:hypothetical protein